MGFLARERRGAVRLLGLLILGVLTNCSSGTNSGAIGGGDDTMNSAGAPDNTIQAGRERGPCYGNRTCNRGLTCASGICVRLPDNGGGSSAGDMSTAGVAAMSGSGVGAMMGMGGSGEMGGDPNPATGGDGSSSSGTGGMSSAGTSTLGGVSGTGGSSAGTGGSSAGTGGSSAGTGGSNAGSSGTGVAGSSGSGGANGGVGGTSNGGVGGSSGGVAGGGSGGVGGSSGGVSGGGTGGASGCDVTASCGACTQCETQASAACQDAMQKCMAQPQCTQLQMCMQMCSGDKNCDDKCMQTFPSGVAAWSAVANCVCGGCPSSCAGDAGWNCPGGGGTGGSGGTGGTGGSPSCDVMGACGKCAQCAEMPASDCGQLTQACQMNPGCAMIQMCTMPCNGDQQCISTCLAKATPDQVAQWQPLADCVCQSCSNSCSDNAGYGCPMATGGSGGSGGSGGTGGVASCDSVSADCPDCQDCSAQQDGGCFAAYANCAKDPACVGYEQCLGGCNGDAMCITKCKGMFPPNGPAEYQMKIMCTCSVCPSTCGKTGMCQ